MVTKWALSLLGFAGTLREIKVKNDLPLRSLVLFALYSFAASWNAPVKSEVHGNSSFFGPEILHIHNPLPTHPYIGPLKNGKTFPCENLPVRWMWRYLGLLDNRKSKIALRLEKGAKWVLFVLWVSYFIEFPTVPKIHLHHEFSRLTAQVQQRYAAYHMMRVSFVLWTGWGGTPETEKQQKKRRSDRKCLRVWNIFGRQVSVVAPFSSRCQGCGIANYGCKFYTTASRLITLHLSFCSAFYIAAASASFHSIYFALFISFYSGC